LREVFVISYQIHELLMLIFLQRLTPLGQGELTRKSTNKVSRQSERGYGELVGMTMRSIGNSEINHHYSNNLFIIKHVK